MRLHEITETGRAERDQHLGEAGPSDTGADAANRQADGMLKRAKLAKKRAAVMKSRQQLSAKQFELGQALRDATKLH